jgi:hypothetical protein
MDDGGLRSNSESLTGGFCRQPYALVDKIPQSGTTDKYLDSDGEILDSNTFSANSRTCELLKNAELTHSFLCIFCFQGHGLQRPQV